MLRDCWTAKLAQIGGLLSLRYLLAHISFSRTHTEGRGKLCLTRSVNAPDSSFQQPLGQARGTADSAQTRTSHKPTLVGHPNA